MAGIFENAKSHVREGLVRIPKLLSGRLAVSITNLLIIFSISPFNQNNIVMVEINKETKSPVTEGLVRIHKLLSRSLTVSISKCDEYIKTGMPSAEKEEFLMYMGTFIRVMHAHHSGEDDVVFPRFTGVIDAPYNRLKEDHIAISAILDNLEKDVANLDWPKVRKKLTDIQMLWDPHIKAEESSFAARNLNKLSEKEQLTLLDEVGTHSQKTSGPGPITIPFVLYNLNKEDRQEFLKDFPWILKKVFIPILWRRQWKAMDPFLIN